MRVSYFKSATSDKVNSDTGIIHGVSVITVGKAIGHTISVDATTLSQVKAVADSHKNGVKVKANHGTGVEAIVGALRDFRIEGNQLKADLHLLKSSGEQARILEMASTMPESFGLSTAFSGEPQDGFARCTELYSVDLVDDPAANPSGLFSKDNETNKVMKEHIEFFRKQYGLGAAVTDESVLQTMRQKAEAAQIELEAKDKADKAKTLDISSQISAAVAEAIKPVATELAALKTGQAEAQKLADKAERDALVAEASRDGKEIPLSADEINELSVKTLKSMILKLEKKVSIAPRAIKPLTEDDRKALPGAFNRAADKLTTFFNAARNGN